MHLHTINLWLLNYQPKVTKFQPILERLAPAQRQRANTFRNQKRTLEFAISRCLLKHAIHHELGDQPNSIDVREQPGRPPFVEVNSVNGAELKVGISHSGDWVGVVVSEMLSGELLGLDIESLRLDWNNAKARYFCNDQQLIYAASLPNAERQHYLSRLWTHKEAFFKAHQLPVLNAATKSADFANDAFMHSAHLDANYLLSLYCSLPIQINPHFVALDADGKLVGNTKLHEGHEELEGRQGETQQQGLHSLMWR